MRMSGLGERTVTDMSSRKAGRNWSNFIENPRHRAIPFWWPYFWKMCEYPQDSGLFRQKQQYRYR
jgi:hypothetical protein